MYVYVASVILKIVCMFTKLHKLKKESHLSYATKKIQSIDINPKIVKYGYI